MTRLWMRRAVGLAFAAIVPLAAVGLAGARSDRHDESAAVRTLEKTVGYSAERWAALLSTQRNAVARCMQEHGFRYTADRDPYYNTTPHGLFDLETLTAEDTYLSRRGYGVVAIAEALRSRIKSNVGLHDQAYYEALAPRRRKAFAKALQGDDTKPGCALTSVYGLPNGFLPDGGPLGDAYSRGWERVRTSSAYNDWSKHVVGCMRSQGVPLARGDLSLADRPVLVRLIRATGGQMGTDSSGRLHYSIEAADITPRVLSQLPAIGRAEHRLAGVELACRRRFKSLENALSLEAAFGIAAEYPHLTNQLRLALFEAGKSH